MSEYRLDNQEANLIVFRAYNDSRIRFAAGIISNAERLCNRTLMLAEKDFLKSANVYNLTQVFYFFRAYDITTKDRVEHYIFHHNKDMSTQASLFAELQKQSNEQRRTLEAERKASKPKDEDIKKTRSPKKLSPRRQATRFTRALFTEYKIKSFLRNLTEGLSDGFLRFALRDLQKLVMESMTEEICSSVCWELNALGLVRWTYDGPAVLIDSEGVLEIAFGDHLAFVVEGLRPLFAGLQPGGHADTDGVGQPTLGTAGNRGHLKLIAPAGTVPPPRP